MRLVSIQNETWITTARIGKFRTEIRIIEYNRGAAGELSQPDYVAYKLKSVVSPLACPQDRKGPVQLVRNCFARNLMGPWPRLLLGLLPQPSIVISLFSHNRDNHDNRVK